MRGENLDITTHNVGKLIAALRDVPSDGHSVHVDDALFAAGILLPRTMPTPKSLEGENAHPATKLAESIRTLVCQRQYQASIETATADREAFNISQREFDRRARAAAIARDTYGYEWPNRVALAVMERNVAAVLQIFDGPKDLNTESKRALREEYGVDVLQCTAVERRRLFELCGFSDAEQAEWEAQEASDKARKRVDRAVAEAKARAEGTTYQIETGEAMNGREYVDFCITAGFSKLIEQRRGSVTRYWIHDPVKRISRPLRAKDGTLDYARGRLTQNTPEALA